MNKPVPENQKTDADREAERIKAEKKANAEERAMREEAKVGVDRASPGLAQNPPPVASDEDMQ
jgi:regulator of protease activity HflC (stomatin/prohibitin superfamily)